ncbi:MAG: hypothetical protein OJK14_31805 [Achromobacter sp.]|uniref:hypothetical protein n=1 Tax=Achromobacter sp. TaxID=134375 RepID=UPI00258C1C72|nr:hypothetical protein [Achromobacter sp.]MCW0211710.1 hypothetical protein [Achromobacter sp.]
MRDNACAKLAVVGIKVKSPGKKDAKQKANLAVGFFVFVLVAAWPRYLRASHCAGSPHSLPFS